MDSNENATEAVGILQELGLKEYEAKCFVGLTRMQAATARELSDVVDVPRTRIYDAIRVLEAQGLVEVQHSSPQRFRAIPMPEATETLRDRYEDRIEQLQETLTNVDAVDSDDDAPIQEVWSMNGTTAIENRTNELVGDATSEIVLVISRDDLFTPHLIDALNALGDDVDILIGATTDEIERRARESVPGATTFSSGLGWLDPISGLEDGGEPGEETAIGRLMLVDRSAILVSSVHPATGEEQAIFGTGFGNGLVVIARRIMSHGLLTAHDPAQEGAD